MEDALRSSEASVLRLSRGAMQGTAQQVEGYPSGQRGQTVNLLANAYGGSNPPPSTILRSEAYVILHASELRMASQIKRRMSDIAREEIVFRELSEVGQNML